MRFLNKISNEDIYKYVVISSSYILYIFIYKIQILWKYIAHRLIFKIWQKEKKIESFSLRIKKISDSFWKNIIILINK